MNRVLLVVILIVAAFSTAHAQPRPDFSGTWTMDRSRSDSAVQNVPVARMTIVIAQTANEIRIETTRDGQTSAFVHQLDGSETKLPDGVATTRWVGTALVTEMIRDVKGVTITTKETRRLNADGSEMLVETVAAVQHGYTQRGARSYGNGTDVFVRASR